MNREIIAQHITTHGTKELLIAGRKRLCYLIVCKQCSTPHYKEEHELTRGIRRNKDFFCSRECLHNHQSTGQEVVCANCSTSFSKLPSQIAKTKNNFCSKSCAATYNNKNKKFGTRRSKLERLIEAMLRTDYPHLAFYCNDKETIGSEIDFYFPILHYQPIYGQTKLDQIQRMDSEKKAACQHLNIKLVEVDCSQDKYLNKNKIQERLAQVGTILAEAGVIETQTG